MLNLANNHVGDYGSTALLDTVRYVRRYGMTPVGAGGSLASAAKPRVVERLGLRVAFVGFSDDPAGLVLRRPGQPGHRRRRDPARVRSSVRGAPAPGRRRDRHLPLGRRAGGPREPTSARARRRVALDAGATAVIGAHPHVLQPIRRQGRKLVAFSLGNFVFGAASPGTTSTGILRLRLSADGVEGSRFLRARIEGTRPRLL